MSYSAFQRLPHRLGWKHEFVDGTLCLTPVKQFVPLELELIGHRSNHWGEIRPATPDDVSGLYQPFLEAFAKTPDFARMTTPQYRKWASKYLDDFFQRVRWPWSAASVVGEQGGEIVAAALIVTRPTGPLLDCLCVRPDYARKGWGTALLTRVAWTLRNAGEKHLASYTHLGNEPSLNYHLRFGFQELPDCWTAYHRFRHYEHECDRYTLLRNCPEVNRVRILGLKEYWGHEWNRLEKLEEQAWRN